MQTLEWLTPTLNEAQQNALRQILQDFTAQYGIVVNDVHIEWSRLWQELARVAIYRRGPDVAEIGSTWLESLAEMNAIRSFSAEEIRQIGGTSLFLQTSWQTVLGIDGQVWAIPFRADVRVVYYWKDVVEQAGIDPQNDFSSPEKFEDALIKLTRYRQFPLVTNTHPSDINTVYHAAIWIWGNGGDFLTPDGKEVRFNDAPALQGLRQHFSLAQFIRPIRYLSNEQLGEIFVSQNAAVAIQGPWLLQQIKNLPNASELMPLLGITLPPGPPFVGGTALAIWQYSLKWRPSLAFIRYMISLPVQTWFCVISGLLPVRADAWSAGEFLTPPYQILLQALKAGRSLPAVPLWGVVEARLDEAFGKIWSMLMENPKDNIDAILRGILNPLAEQMNSMLRG